MDFDKCRPLRVEEGHVEPPSVDTYNLDLDDPNIDLFASKAMVNSPISLADDD